MSDGLIVGSLVHHPGFTIPGIVIDSIRKRTHLQGSPIGDYWLTVHFEHEVFEDWWFLFTFVNSKNLNYNCNDHLKQGAHYVYTHPLKGANP